ncbi:MAG: hypothetical protein FJ280_09460 [Planctomycetes bacterium]|nr:hypothetical protein [Planctomycetota bacterium]
MPKVFVERFRLRAAVLVLATALLFWLVAPLAGAEPARRPPNILWRIAENMGPDLGCYGARHVLTPNQDRLAAQGMRDTHAFAAVRPKENTK